MEVRPHHAWRGRLSGRVLLGTASIAMLVVFVAVVVALLAYARSDLAAGQAAALGARDALARQDVAAARDAFSEATDEFARARRRLSNPLLRILDLVPVARHNVEAARTGAEAARLLSRAGELVAHQLDEGLGGTAALAPVGGRIPLEPLQEAAEPAAEAAASVRHAAALLEQADSPWLIGSVAEAHRELREQAVTATRLADTAAALTRGLPSFLGADGPRRYFFGAGNPAELRGAGGFIGAYAVLTIDDGRLSFGPFASIAELPTADVEPPNPEYAARYDRYGGAEFWHNINMTPDFPSAATAIERLFEASTGQRLDGTIVADPAALAALLEVTGPADVPGIGPVSAEEIVPLMANEAFGEFDDSDERKRALGSVAAGVFDRFLQSGVDRDPLAAGRALAGAASAGHLLVHAADPITQEALSTAGIAGGLPVDEGDFLSVVGNNAAGNKVDFYTDRAITYRATLRPGGSVQSRAVVTLHNEAPTTGEPRHVIGPYSGTFLAGDNLTILSTYCAPGCNLQEFERNGETAPIVSESELGLPVYSTSVHLGSGESAELAYRWTTPDAWVPDSTGGTYRLTIRDQMTIRPTRLDLAVTVPDGLQVVATSHDLRRNGAQLTWSGEVRKNEIFEIRLRRPRRQLVVDLLTSWVNRPLLVNLSG